MLLGAFLYFSSFIVLSFVLLGGYFCFIRGCICAADMVEIGKRSRPQWDNENDDKYQKRRGSNKDNLVDGELVVYRILCPDGVIGSVIGKSGKVINTLRQETRARIKVVDPFLGANERVITIYCYEKNKNDREVDEDNIEPLCPAQDALLKVHCTIANAVANIGDSDKKHKEEVRILVPGSQAANVIGKSGSTIKKLRTKTNTNIKVIAKDPNDPTHSYAMSFDNIVQVISFQLMLMFFELSLNCMHEF